MLPRMADGFRLSDVRSMVGWLRTALRLVRETSPGSLVVLALLTPLAGLLPAGIAWAGKGIVDGIVASDGAVTLRWLGLEVGLVVALSAAQRGLGVNEALLRARLGQHVNEVILGKALQLSLPQFEDAKVYDLLTRARREASSRPLSLVRRAFGLAQNLVALVSYGGLLVRFSPLAVGVLVLAAIPAFVAETRFAGAAFRLFKWRVPETRQQAYLETAIAREDFVKEGKLFDLGGLFLGRYRAIFEKLYAEDRTLTLRRGAVGWAVGLLSTAAFYGAYVWIALSALSGRITLGDMTLYLLLFRQGQTALSSALTSVGGIYEDGLYLSTLDELLALPVPTPGGVATTGPAPEDGLRLEGVRFTYPGATRPALDGVDLHVRPGETLALVGANGSGKTTLIKLVTRLYEPQEGRLTLDGRDLREWDPAALRARFGVIFQDFVRWQLTAGENVGVGDAGALDDAGRQESAARRGDAHEVLTGLPEGYHTQLGRWFDNGRELSGGQWQKVAVSRAFMRRDADILVLDEPTAALDAEAEARVFERVMAEAAGRMTLLISHRFSTVRRADRIVVLDGGRVVEAGDHEALLAAGGRYARLFTLQAEGYR